MARQLAAAAVLERLVESVGVHDIIGKQHKPEPKEAQVSPCETVPHFPPPTLKLGSCKILYSDHLSVGQIYHRRCRTGTQRQA